MTTATAPGLLLAGTQRESALQRALRQATPAEGWLTLALVLAPLFVIAWTISEAAWAETPSLYGILFVGGLMGLGVAKAPGRQWLWALGAVVPGAAFVYWQLSTLTGVPGYVEPFRVLNSRLQEWGETASDGGISTDTLPFALALTTLAWVIGYVSVWSAFRRRSVWLSVVPGGLAMFSNLSYLPDRFGVQMFIYLAFAMLLMVRMNGLNQAASWAVEGLAAPAHYGARALLRGSVYIVAVLLIAIVLPARSMQSGWLDAAWEWTRSPLDTIEEDLDRLFAALPDRKGGLNLNFGSHMPFRGPLSLSDEPLFLLEATQPAYLRARTYPTYTPQGWTTGGVETVGLPESLPWSRARNDSARLTLDYNVVPLFGTKTMPVANLPLSAESSSADAQALALAAPAHWLPIVPDVAPDPGIPDDIAAMQPELLWERLYDADPERQANVLTAALPEGAVISQLAYQDTPDGGAQRSYRVEAAEPGGERATLLEALRSDIRTLAWVQVARRPPDPPDILAVRSADRLNPGDSYAVTSSLSTARPAQLQAAGDDYPGWVRDVYLQLPEDQPERIGALAHEITIGTISPYDKAKAIETHLRTLDYDQDIPAPPFNADGIEYFLFDLERGYSEYFGSAMAVLLREVGVPARVVVGYAPREYDAGAGHYVVREEDSHGWAEAYFPGYGWVEFEPTPNWRLPRSQDSIIFEAVAGGGQDDDFFDEDEFLEDEAFLPFDPLPLQRESPVSGGMVAGALGAAFAVWLLWYAYRRAFVKVATPGLVFERMCVMGAWGGVRHRRNQTPLEYAARLAAIFPQAAASLHLLGNAHAVSLFSGRATSQSEEEQVQRAWGTVRQLLWRRLLWRNPFATPA